MASVYEAAVRHARAAATAVEEPKLIFYNSMEERSVRVAVSDTVNPRKLIAAGYVLKNPELLPAPQTPRSTPPVASTAPEGDTLATASGVAPTNTADTIAAFEAAASAEASPAQPAGPAVPTSPEITIEAVLADLERLVEPLRDTRIESAIGRIKRYTAEHRAGTYVPPRFIKPLPSPTGF